MHVQLSVHFSIVPMCTEMTALLRMCGSDVILHWPIMMAEDRQPEDAGVGPCGCRIVEENISITEFSSDLILLLMQHVQFISEKCTEGNLLDFLLNEHR